MERTNEYRQLVEKERHKLNISNFGTKLTPSPFTSKASEVYAQIDKFERILLENYEGFVGVHRFLSPSMITKKTKPLTADERENLAKEVSVFISNSAKSVQDLNRMLDLKTEGQEESLPSQFSRLVISSILHKLNRFSGQWDKMQKDHKKHNISPFRMLSKFYTHHLTVPMSEESLAEDKREEVNKSPPLSYLPPTGLPAISPLQAHDVDHAFAQRYVDEMASTKKLEEYERVAKHQKEKLLKEAKSLHQKLSQEMLESYHMEHTVQSISSLVGEFSNMIESQSEVVTSIGEVAKDVTQSVENTDEELIKTLERSQSHSFSMIFLLLGLALLLLLLHILSP